MCKDPEAQKPSVLLDQVEKEDEDDYRPRC